jgi:leucine dehydrogenase
MNAAGQPGLSFEALLSAWDGEQVVIRFLPRFEAWMFIGLHSRVLGPATGGTRLKVYKTPVDGLRDALRLAEAMTLKMAITNLPCGGGKAVLAVPTLPRGRAREHLLETYAETVASLGGSFRTGPDLNTGPSDMDLLARRTRYVFCRSKADGGSGDSGVHTAEGVLYAIRASLRHVFGSPTLAGRSILVQGLGSVGASLVRLAAGEGARILLSDIDARRAREVAKTRGGNVVAASEATSTECDVYAPCAVGGVLTAETIPNLRCRIVAGAANNQLEAPLDAELLHQAGILYAPDFVSNAGGVLHAVGTEMLGWRPEATKIALAGIGDSLAAIFERSERAGISTDSAARAIAAERLNIGERSKP